MQPGEVVRPYLLDLIDLLLRLVRVENEDNAALCMKSIMDIQRAQGEAAATRVQPFLDLIKEIFDGMGHAVQETFDVPNAAAAAGTVANGPGSTPSGASGAFASPRPSSPAASATGGPLDAIGGGAVGGNLDQQQASRPLPRGMQSFKVLAECPIIVVSLFQAHKGAVQANVRHFVPLIKGVLLAEAGPQAAAHQEAARRGTIFVGVAREIRNRAAFGDLVTAQVKTMSFLAYLLRAYTKHLDDFLPVLPNICIRMLRDCPSEKSAARKELLVAIRHIINFNFREIFRGKVDDLLDERTLIGDGLTVYETMRPLAYSMLADLIHHVRDELTAEQIQRTIDTFSKYILEDFPGTSFQTMCAKLLLGMADAISNLPSKEDGRHFLILIMNTVASKFELMNKEYPNAVALSKRHEGHNINAVREEHLADPANPPDWDETDIFHATPIKTSMPRDQNADPVEDNKFLFKNLMSGLKGLFYRLRATNPESSTLTPDSGGTPGNWKDVSHSFTAEEVEVITRLFHEGARVFRYYALEQPPPDQPYASPIEYWANFYMLQSGKDERELLETFATAFHCVDPATFHEVFQAQIPRLYELMFEHTALLHVPQFFLASEATSPSFAGMLLQFLMDRLPDVGSADIKKSSILLRMFKLSFMAVTLFSTQNEQVLLPHVTKLVTQAIQLATTVDEPLNYFFLLRSLFRSIGGGRFELLYKEILPLLEMLLEVLNGLLAAARRPAERHLYVELCLTVPARLSNLLPHLSYLMRPLVVALRAEGDLVGQGLRTLELCVDNLTADYLDPIMAPVIDDLMQALWDHLRPAPYSHFHSHTTMRILGKLGGRNRKFLTRPPPLDFRAYADDEPGYDLRLLGSAKDRAFPSRIGVDIAIARLHEAPKTPTARAADDAYKPQALRFVAAQIKMHLGADQLPEDFARAVRLQANDLADGNAAAALDFMERSSRDKSIAKRDAQEDSLRALLRAAVFACTLPELQAQAQPLVADVCRHFALVDLGTALARRKHRAAPFSPTAGEGPLGLDVRVLADALVDSLADDQADVRDAATAAIRHVFDAAVVLFGDASRASKLPLFGTMARAFAHACYAEEWFTKAGGALGIDALAVALALDDAWLRERQVEFYRALLFLVRDLPPDLPSKTRVQALATLEVILRRCNADVSTKDLENKETRLFQLCGLIANDLSHQVRPVREAAQAALKVLAACAEAEEWELLRPFTEQMLHPPLSKPLRALAFPVQIGYIEAVTFFLRLGHGLVAPGDPLNRIVVETLALTDADDETLAAKPAEYRTAQLLVQLRVSCIGLLRTALGLPESASLAAAQQPATRNRIIAVFFKSLYSPAAPVVDAAFDGLKGVLSQTNKLQKDLLQSGLRPLLMNLQDHRKLSVGTLDGLARLLRLLTNYFKTEIGDRLLLHADTLCAEAALHRVSFGLVEQDRAMQIVAAVLHVFHLLPASAVSMLPRLVTKVIDTEARLRRTRRSPFRSPLLKYLGRHPRDAWDFFAPRFADLRAGRFFAQLLAHPEAAKLREPVLADPDRLASVMFPSDQTQRGDARCVNGIHAAHALVRHRTAWLVGQETLRTALLDAGRFLRARQKARRIEGPLRLPAYRAGEMLIDVLVAYLTAAPTDLDFLFRLIEAVTADEIKMQEALKGYLYREVICNESVPHQRAVVMRCIELYAARGTAQRLKTFVFQNLVNPILAMDVMNGSKAKAKEGESNSSGAPSTRLMDKSLLDAIHNKLWRPQLGDVSDDGAPQPGVDHSRLALLQTSAFLLKYHHGLVTDTRKDIIKFGWAYIRFEDTINKHAAYVLIAFFIALFDSPAKIVTQVYVALLRAYQNEGRALVIQALDLIAPVLPKRLQGGPGPGGPGSQPPAPPGNGSSDAGHAMWARWPKRILAEEGQNLQQLICVLQFMIRTPGLFYAAREHFVPVVVGNLAKLAAPPSPSNDSKKLALNAIEMIRDWETRRIKGAAAAAVVDGEVGGSVEGSPVKPASQTQAQGERSEWQIPAPQRMLLIKYLANLLSTFVERYPVPAAQLRELNATPSPLPLPPAHAEIVRKAFALFHDFLAPGYWTDLGVDLFPKLCEGVLASEKADRALQAELAGDRPDDKNVAMVMNTLQIVRIVLNTKNAEWIQGQIGFLQRVLEKVLRADSPEIQDCLHAADLKYDNDRVIKPLLRSILDAIPTESGDEDDMEVETPGTEFLNFLANIATETLAANNFVAGLNILSTLAQVRPEMIDPQVPHIMRALQQKLTKDHLAGAAAAAAAGTNASQPNAAAAAAARVQAGEQAPTPPDPRETELQVQLILKGIDILARRISVLGEQRRPFLANLANLVEKSPEPRLCEAILALAEQWVFDSNEPWPTLKEKTAVLHKMLGFEARPDPALLHRFLDLVLRIYEDPRITRTELTVRLEHAFLVGTRAKDVPVRGRFMAIFDRSLTRTAPARLLYVLTSQNWDTLSETCWLSQAVQLVLGSVDGTAPAQLHADDFRLLPPSQVFRADDPRREQLMVDDKLEALVEAQRRFCASIGDVRARDLLEPLAQLQHSDSGETTSQIWSSLFPLCWAALSREDRMELEKGLVGLLTKDYHQRQIDRRPNVVQSLLEGVVRARPKVKFPPHVLKFLAKTYDAWYTVLVALEDQVNEPLIDTPTLRESNLDALLETYAGIQADDLYYGTWRRRCKFVETNAALSYEQMGMWDKALGFYDAAQVKARTGVVPFSQGEYMLWEDHWLGCAQKLQQWDVLGEFAKHENMNDLLLEASYRNPELWAGAENLEGIGAIVKAVSDAPTPRRAFFQAFLALLRYHDGPEAQLEFNRVSDEAMQLSIRKWHQLPVRITQAHIPILQGFQQLIELNDGQTIFQSLHTTTAANLDAKSQELKLTLGTWRDRLPNTWDDINAWQSLVTWRQHIFNHINKTYLNLIQTNGGAAGGAGAGGAGGNGSNSFAYRGYHETAWIINRFAHVARKHQLPEVCISQLSKIYTLPNIEIQEAFLKLREQAKCHYQNRSELNNGLDVINNTNLNYFNLQQKAEFYTLKGMFQARLGAEDEANEAFGVALQFDIHLPKAWAEWGYYNDAIFKRTPHDADKAAAAVSCYLEAASLFKSAKSRKLLSRILWLLSIDGPDGRIARAFEDFKGEAPVWYWITFIPQLLTSLSQREARIARGVLVKIAKQFPQALYYHMRTQREDMVVIKRQAEQKMEKLNQQQQQQKQQQASPAAKTEPGNEAGADRPSSNSSRPNTANGDTTMTNGANGATNGTAGQTNGASASPKREDGQNNADEQKKEPEPARKPWEHSEEIMQILKTAFPLLALSMETMVDQIQKHFKCPPDEDAYRLIVALLNDGLAYIGRMPNAYAEDYKLPPGTEANIRKFAETILPPHIRSSFEEDFVAHKPTMHEYIQKLRKWRDKFEEKLDRRPRTATLESYHHLLSEFRFARFDDVEVPGQYLLHRDKNTDFVRIDRFLPDVDLVRTVGFSHRRVRIRGTDGSIYSFAVQHPAARHSRREERTLQLFRIFNGALAKRKEARRRNLSFYLPLMVPLAPAIRLVQEEANYISLQGVYEDHCRRHGLNKDDPVLFTMERMRSMADARTNVNLSLVLKMPTVLTSLQKYPDQAQNLRMEVLRAVQEKWVPNTVALEYFQRTHPSFADFWLFRRQAAQQLAALTFMTYTMHMTARYPHKLAFARDSGRVWGAELIPNMGAKCLFHNPEPVPFRLTPNLQALLGPLGTEGPFAAAVMAVARCLTEPEGELEHTLGVFVRDEVMFWATSHRTTVDGQMRERVLVNVDTIVKKALALARTAQGTLPAHQTIIDTISAAVDPMRLAQADALWMPYL